MKQANEMREVDERRHQCPAVERYGLLDAQGPRRGQDRLVHAKRVHRYCQPALCAFDMCCSRSAAFWLFAGMICHFVRPHLVAYLLISRLLAPVDRRRSRLKCFMRGEQKVGGWAFRTPPKVSPTWLVSGFLRLLYLSFLDSRADQGTLSLRYYSF